MINTVYTETKNATTAVSELQWSQSLKKYVKSTEAAYDY